mgnify:CR=1 FL=1
MRKNFYYVWSIIEVYIVFNHILNQKWLMAIIFIPIAIYFIKLYLNHAND